jgi:hypothetical protein
MANVRISDDFMKDARECSKISLRSVGKQIEYWAKIGKAAEDNPDLNVDFIKNCFEGLREVESGKTAEFRFSDLT